MKIEYKKIKPIIIHLDELVEDCSLFHDECEINNAYCCREMEKDYSGACYGFDCPLANPADMKDLKELGRMDIYKEYEKKCKESKIKEENFRPSDYGDSWLRQHSVIKVFDK